MRVFNLKISDIYDELNILIAYLIIFDNILTQDVPHIFRLLHSAMLPLL